ncbi:chaperone modulatory protein CbpM [Hymenobacter roseosalivarius DSM 11622]|uniref:Chaperone modulatory protein CbpM n=1 Tax=Hymenobacter roseosalivarius DSM 11622 TaxID=645990 RepID=A0A1W1USP2_9BACT|nr:chaperone modulator CbpM [Hymenobacter roseosalivarius]SMB84066.1 chaperone modulatory protein CbpM [Hymenobacter roseosalivarius DSM 11622]
METLSIITITFHDCATRYGLSEPDLHAFVDLGLLHPAEAPDTLRAEPDNLARLARLRHELGLSAEGIDIVLAMRHRLLELQTELARQRARVAQLEYYLNKSGPLVDL